MIIKPFLEPSMGISSCKYNIEDFHRQHRILIFLNILYYPSDPVH